MSVADRSTRRFFGTIALAIALAEPALIWTVTIIALRHPGHDWRWLESPMAVVYVIGLGAIPLAVIGLIKDAMRVPALTALVIALINVVVCAVPFSV
jgi:hypothetical protein